MIQWQLSDVRVCNERYKLEERMSTWIEVDIPRTENRALRVATRNVGCVELC